MNTIKLKNSRPGIPSWVITLLLIFTCSITGIVMNYLARSPIPFYLLLGFSLIYSVEKWFSQVTKRSKATGKLYRFILNLGILSMLGLLIWSGIKLFSGSFHYNPIVGSLIFLAEFVFFIWIWKVIAKNSWRWPSMKLTVFSLLCLSVVSTFAGVQPLSTYKDNLVANWKEYQVEQAAKQAAGQEQREAERVAEEPKVVVEPGPIKPKSYEPTKPVIYKPTLRNPSWEELKAFLLEDDTDKMEYVYPTTVCWDFANKLQKNAKEASWRCAVVRLDMTGYTDPYNYGIAHNAGHACNAFETTDRGLVYIDCTAAMWGPLHQDRIVDIQIGKQYNPKHIFSSSGWGEVPSGQMGIVRDMSIQW